MQCIIQPNIFLTELLFNPGMTTIHVEIAVLYDATREISEIFTVHIGEDRNGLAEVKVNTASFLSSD